MDPSTFFDDDEDDLEDMVSHIGAQPEYAHKTCTQTFTKKNCGSDLNYMRGRPRPQLIYIKGGIGQALINVQDVDPLLMSSTTPHEYTAGEEA